MIATRCVERALDTEVYWRLFPAGPAIVDAFQRGEIDMAYIGLPPAIIGIERGIAMKCIAGGHVEGTVICGSGSKIFKGFPEMHKLDEILKQFSGYRIGVPGRGSIHDVILSECLEVFNLKDDIEVVNFAWADRIIGAMNSGYIAGAFGTPALAVAVQRYSDGKILYPPARLFPNNPSYGIVISKSFLHKEKEMVKRFLFLHENTNELLRNKPEEAAQIISDCVGIVDKKFVLNTLRISPKYCAMITDNYISSTMEFVRILRKLGYINRQISADEIFDTSLISEIHPEKDHYGEGVDYS
jgi:NitT/TauT family transport system substrate-binding protein